MTRLFSNRKYKSGSHWALFRWSEVPSDFIVRLHLFMTPFGAICIHWINKPDPEPFIHDHPVSFISFILKGWYIEIRAFGPFIRLLKKRRFFNFIRAEDAHTIIRVSPGGAITLCFMGPKTREWGYHTDNSWVHWKTYNTEKYSASLQDN